jgi:hypothetical protein
MKRITKMACMILSTAAAAAALGSAWLRPALHPATEAMTDTRLEAERWLLFDAARELPWWLGWGPAIRHKAVSEEWYSRSRGPRQRYSERRRPRPEHAQPPKGLHDHAGDSDGI